MKVGLNVDGMPSVSPSQSKIGVGERLFSRYRVTYECIVDNLCL